MVELPGMTGLSVLAGLNTGDVASGGTYSVKLNEDAVQLVSIVNENDVPVLMALPVIGQAPMTENIGAATTGRSTAFSQPFSGNQ